MDGNMVALIVVTLANICGWAISYGKLRQKVNDMDDILKNGLIKKVDGMSNVVASLDSRLNTYIELKEHIKGR